MLKVTFPHIGNSYIPFRAMLIELGLDPVVPPLTTQRTIALGTQLAPEFACFPLKVNIGNYLEAFELGADAVFMAGGVGPCRFGYYGEVQREILRDAGYDVEFLVLEAPKTHPRELWEKMKRYFPRHRIPDLIRAARMAWEKAAALDRIDRLMNLRRPMIRHHESLDAIQQRFYTQLDEAMAIETIRHLTQRAVAEIEAIPRENRLTPLKIMLLGEIYMVLEPRVNFAMEKCLGNMGVTVHRSIYFTDWVRDQLLFSIINPSWRNRQLGLAKPYLSGFVGGHGLETVAHTVDAGVNRMDGVLQIMPFTCMPEIVALQVLPAVTRDLQIPVLTVIIDEHAAEAGIATRLEAFYDLLLRRQRSNNGGKSLEVISRC